MDSFNEGIKNERTKISLVPKASIIVALRNKITEVTGVIPDTIRRIALKALDDVESCDTEQQLIECLRKWAEITAKQTHPEVQYFMNGMGSIIIRVDLSNQSVENSDG